MTANSLDKYYPILIENEVTDFETLIELSEADLLAMGFTIGAKTKMIKKI